MLLGTARTLVVFDLDDTLFRSDHLQIFYRCPIQGLIPVTSEKFYALLKDATFDDFVFPGFDCHFQFRKATPIVSPVKDCAQWLSNPDADVHLVTLRENFIDFGHFVETLHQHNLPFSHENIWLCGREKPDDGGNRKRITFDNLFASNKYGQAIIYEDNEDNIKSFAEAALLHGVTPENIEWKLITAND